MLRPYRETLLAPGEAVVHITRPHVLPHVGALISGASIVLLGLAGYVIADGPVLLPGDPTIVRPVVTAVFALSALGGLISIAATWIRWRSREIVVTDRRVLRITGILNKGVVDNSLDAITDLQLHQSIWGRLFNFGDVDILTASDVDDEVRPDTFPDVAGPVGFMRAVQDRREARRFAVRSAQPPASPNAP